MEYIDHVRQWIGENHRTIAISVGSIFIAVKVGSKLKDKLDQIKTQRILKKWESAPRDVVILHTLPRGKTVPNVSPFAMKLETYLRIAKIQYEVDFESPWSTVGKTPWITLNGQHVTDSQVIIDLLRREYNKDIGNFSDEQRAVAKAVRIMLDEYLYWGFGLWRWHQSEGQGLEEIFDMPEMAVKCFYRTVNPRVVANAWAQGIGRHSQDQIINMMKETLLTASLILGDKHYLLGNKPCEEDCSLFGFLSQAMWALPDSPYEKYMKEELPNLRNYCLRMKERYWDDWNNCLA